ncbi:MAG: lamin tail domain-containing protein, partial [Chloroflexota bacterium]|nr:lamin tail domain-containing protein [Dehalococcoidia bacterium]MDW8047678.1 lamin tail domain-containing protein [Chloroflexota bacterium]
VRLMLDPDSAAAVTAWFDDAWFGVTDERPSDPPPLGDGGASGSPTASPPRSGASGTATPRPTSTPRSSGGTSRGGTAGAASSAVAGDVAGGGALRLSEFLPAPDAESAANDYEWVELYNAGDVAVDLAGWSVGDARSLAALPSFRLEPGAYVVVAAPKAILPEGVPVLRLAGRIGNGLNNSGDIVRLVAPGGARVDAVAYGDDRSLWSAPPPAPAKDETLARLAFDTSGPEAWDIALRPTPGGPNVFAAPPGAGQPSGGATAAAAGRGQTGTDAVATAAAEAVRGGAEGASAVPWIVVGAAAGASLASLVPLIGRAGRWKQIVARVRRRAR